MGSAQQYSRLSEVELKSLATRWAAGAFLTRLLTRRLLVLGIAMQRTSSPSSNTAKFGPRGPCRSEPLESPVNLLWPLVSVPLRANLYLHLAESFLPLALRLGTIGKSTRIPAPLRSGSLRPRLLGALRGSPPLANKHGKGAKGKEKLKLHRRRIRTIPASNEIHSVRSARSRRKCAAFFGEDTALPLHVGGSSSKLASFYGLFPAPQSYRPIYGTFGRDAFYHAAIRPREELWDGGPERSTTNRERSMVSREGLTAGRERYERSTLGRDTYSLGSSTSMDGGYECSKLMSERDGGDERSAWGRASFEWSLLGRDTDTRGSSKSSDCGHERSRLGRERYERSPLSRDTDSRGSSRRASTEPIAGSKAAIYIVTGTAFATASPETVAPRRGSSMLALDLAVVASNSYPPLPPPRSSQPGGSAFKLSGAVTIACESENRKFDAAAGTLSKGHRHTLAIIVCLMYPRSLRSLPRDCVLRRSSDPIGQAASMFKAERNHDKALSPLPLSNGSIRKLLFRMGRSRPIDVSLKEIAAKGIPSLLDSRIAFFYFLSFLLTEFDAEMLIGSPVSLSLPSLASHRPSIASSIASSYDGVEGIIRAAGQSCAGGLFKLGTSRSSINSVAPLHSPTASHRRSSIHAPGVTSNNRDGSLDRIVPRCCSSIHAPGGVFKGCSILRVGSVNTDSLDRIPIRSRSLSSLRSLSHQNSIRSSCTSSHYEYGGTARVSHNSRDVQAFHKDMEMMTSMLENNEGAPAFEEKVGEGKRPGAKPGAKGGKICRVLKQVFARRRKRT
ncbi:hypothetical protein BDK51DRAFT_39934 [Blyttiomyces helicus]|uniref:Uncharacterized protein n=1 Tax=Blyttiomyces helicus TaxID=388810 RepID=A0A4P9WNI9_9FUNG|nr:hypothetical protein BDK51DRAFT_39934 [Blyttiomyces helicus]|eukprot:RKO93845.1 hypothetical protein BDK51DRAFT_39934 [Blyttiomyces helicus]